MIRPAGAVAGQSASLWILGPRLDLLLFVLPPLWILPLAHLARSSTDLGAMGLWVMALGGLGHHLPGWIRAYSDPVLWREYRYRLTLGPALVLGMCTAFAFLNLHALVFVYGAWSLWHGATQVHGFHRIYDARVGLRDSATARLDLALCLAWFGAAVMHSPLKLVSLLGNLYGAGGPLVPPGAIAAGRWAWDAGTLLVTAAYLLHAWRLHRAGTPANPVKYLALVSSIGFWWGTLTLVDEMIWGVVLWEIFHVVQYNALAWVQGRRRVDQEMPGRWLERVLFRPGAGPLLGYLALTCLYGLLGVYMHYDAAGSPGKAAGLSDPGLTTLLTRIVVASALLHFYFDGFIWQVRQGHFRRGLGMEVAKGEAQVPARPAGIAHAWKWLLFLVPAALLGWRQHAGLAVPQKESFRNLVAVNPENWGMHLMVGFLEMAEGRMDSAAEHLRRSAALNPAQAFPHQLLGDLEAEREDWPASESHYLEALRLDTADTDPVEGMALLKLRSGDGEGALPWLHRLAASGTHRAWALNGIGEVLEAQGRPDEAAAYYRDALGADPRFGGAAENLAKLRGR